MNEITDKTNITLPDSVALHPGYNAGLPVGCMIERIKAEALVKTIENIVNNEDPKSAFESFSKAVKETLPDRPSRKHMADCDLGRQDPTESLKYQMAS